MLKPTVRLSTYLAMSTMTLSGSLAIVKMKRAMGGPKAMKPHPKNSMIVILVMDSLLLKVENRMV